MSRPIIGSEALAAGKLTRGQLRSRYTPLHRDIFIPKGTDLSLPTRTIAAWLSTGRTGIIAGRAAAALHGAQWCRPDDPVEMIAGHLRRRRRTIVRQERIADDEITGIAGMPVTTPARTAFDLARHLHRDAAVPRLDALAAATGLRRADVIPIVDRYPGARGIKPAGIALSLMDAGAQSPRESWLRLLLFDAGMPKPRTQIQVSDGNTTAFIDLGWDEPKIGLDYEGEHHRSERAQFVKDIGRYEMIDRVGWIDLRVVKEHSRPFILQRVRDAFAQRNFTPNCTPWF